MNWREYPFVRLLAPFVLGILLVFFAVPGLLFLRHTLVLLLPLLAMLLLAWRRVGYHSRWLFGFSATLFFLALGYQLTYWHDDWNRSDHFRYGLSEKEKVMMGLIVSVQEKGERWEARLEIQGFEDTLGIWRHSGGRLLAYLVKDSTSIPQPGDRILFQGRINRIAPPDNPAAFDFSRYMRVQNIYFQTFLPAGRWQVLPAKGGAARLSAHFGRRQSQAVAVLSRHLTDRKAFGVGSALILGHRGGLDQDLKEAYGQTGAMHVLAVSGLHVGLIALFLGFVLGRIPVRRPCFTWFRFFLQILGIWSFALLTGGSPSVLRAAGMFTMLLLGLHLQRYANIYNTLAASAFLLLCVRPFMLLELSFQLSYLAVLGIVYFQPRLYRLWYIPHRAGQWIWKLTCVSLAAQITTLPISLYYFHQFPVYFWLSGLVVVPAAMLILPLGLLLIAVSRVSFLATALGKLLLWIVMAVNGAIHFIQQLPGHLISGIWITGLTVALLYVFILCVVLRLETNRRSWLQTAMVFLLLIGMQHIWLHWNSHQQRRLVFYRIYQHTALDFIDGRQTYALVDGQLPPEKLDRTNRYFRWSQLVKESRTLRLEQDTALLDNWMYRDGFAQFYDLRLAVLDRPAPVVDQPIRVDYLLIRGNPELDISTLLQSYDPGRLVFDSSNHYRSVERWKAACRTLEQPYYDLNEQGALIVDLNKRG